MIINISDTNYFSETKWESGYVYPDISNLIKISNIFNVTVDYLVKEQAYSINIVTADILNLEKLMRFRLEANVNTYAAYMNETTSTRMSSHDFTYSNGPYTYYDTYVGGETFAGEEAIWYEGFIQYAMNYCGQVLNQQFSGDFTWFQGYEEIFCNTEKVYECYFHGGIMK